MRTKDAIGLWRTIRNRGVAIQTSDVSGANLLYNESKVEYEPAVTNLDETIEESFEDKIVSQETQASYCLLVFLNQRASSVIFIRNWIKWT